jgi:hypothetical protein
MTPYRPPLALAIGLALFGSAQAGSLDSPAAPTDAGSAMYSLESIYQRLDTGAAGSNRVGGFSEPVAGPGATGHTLDQVMAKAPAQDTTNGATAAQVLQGGINGDRP